MSVSDFLIIGGGIAGLSAAARLSFHGRVTVLEAEQSLGAHSSGRSISFSHYGIGGAAVRALTAHSRNFFEHQPVDFSPTPVARIVPSLYFATAETVGALEELECAIAQFSPGTRWLDEEDMTVLCPAFRTGAGGATKGLLDETGLKLDCESLLQSYARALRKSGGDLLPGRRVEAIDRHCESWRVTTEGGEIFEAPILVNAAGAWADRIAVLAGVTPLGLSPKRRTIIVTDPPTGMDPRAWPFLYSAANDFYMLGEAGQLLVSPVDEVDDEPCDAQPDEYDIALAAHRLEQYTHLKVSRIAHCWAGLRSFVADRVPTAGFAPDAAGFFWLAGQGGYGIQTAPAMAEIVEALVTGGVWPAGLAASGVRREHIEPSRLFAANPPPA